jgi:hypothetical protein
VLLRAASALPPHYVLPVSAFQGAAIIRRWQLRTLIQIPPLDSVFFSYRVGPRLLNTVCAQNILRNEADEILKTPKSRVQRITKRLIRAGLLSSYQDVLKLMPEGALLSVISKNRHLLSAEGRTPPEEDDGPQLDRALPIRSAVVGFVLTLALSIGLLLAAVALFGFVHPSRVRPWAIPYLLSKLVAIAAFSTILQYSWPYLRRLKRDIYRQSDEWVALPLAIGTLAIVFSVGTAAYNSHVSTPGETCLGNTYWESRCTSINNISGIAPFVFALFPILLTNTVVPELIDHWRGSHLLYPSNRTLSRLYTLLVTMMLLAGFYWFLSLYLSNS